MVRVPFAPAGSCPAASAPWKSHAVDRGSPEWHPCGPRPDYAGCQLTRITREVQPGCHSAALGRLLRPIFTGPPSSRSSIGPRLVHPGDLDSAVIARARCRAVDTHVAAGRECLTAHVDFAHGLRRLPVRWASQMEILDVELRACRDMRLRVRRPHPGSPSRPRAARRKVEGPALRAGHRLAGLLLRQVCAGLAKRLN
jgi:hypothetical protein